MSKIHYLIVLLTLLSGCDQTPSYRLQHNLAYGPGKYQTYDYYDPTFDVGDVPRPVLLAVHGGGYVGGDKSWAKQVADRFCPLGYVVIGINYTLAPEGTWPRQLDDAQLALNHIRNSTWMNIREPIAGFGVSAGAHLVAALHLQRDLPLAVGASGPWDFVNASNDATDRSLRLLLEIPLDVPISPGDRVMLSATTWANPRGNMLLIHAEQDPLTIYLNAINFEKALRLAGASVSLISIDSSSHGSTWKDAVSRTDFWLKERQIVPD